MEDVNKTLDSRKKTHGEYKNTAEAYSSIKELFDVYWVPDNPIICEPGCSHPADDLFGIYNSELTVALDMIAMKLARIISGDSRVIDHWRDIAGYAMLHANYLEADEGNPHSPNYVYRDKDK